MAKTTFWKEFFSKRNAVFMICGMSVILLGQFLFDEKYFMVVFVCGFAFAGIVTAWFFDPPAPLAKKIKTSAILLASAATSLVFLIWLFGGLTPGSNYRSFANTSMSDALEHPLRKNHTKRPFYDLAYTAYSKDFAQEYGLVESLITELAPGLHYIQLKATTDGDGTRCRITIALDKPLTAALGEDDRLNSMLAGVELPFSDKATPPVARSEAQAAAAKRLNSFPGKALHEYNDLISLIGSEATKQNKPGKVFLQHYLASRSDHLNIVSFNGWCDYWMSALSSPDAAVSIAQPDGKEPLILPIPARLRENLHGVLADKKLSY
jgi:hypothetical protein